MPHRFLGATGLERGVGAVVVSVKIINRKTAGLTTSDVVRSQTTAYSLLQSQYYSRLIVRVGSILGKGSVPIIPFFSVFEKTWQDPVSVNLIVDYGSRTDIQYAINQGLRVLLREQDFNNSLG